SIVPRGTVAMNMPTFVYQQCTMSMCHGNVDLPYTHGYLTEEEQRQFAYRAGLEVGIAAVTWEVQALRAAIAVRAFRSHSAMVRALGSAGRERQWHHIVEQTRGNVARFGAEAIHNTQNVVS